MLLDVRLVRIFLFFLIFISGISFVYAGAQVIFRPDNLVDPGNELTIEIRPDSAGVFKYVYVYDKNEILQDVIILENCIDFVCNGNTRIRYNIPLDWFGDYYLMVYDYSINDYVRGDFIVGSGEFFDRKLNCNRCSDHRVPELTGVNITVIASGFSGNIDLVDYFENDFTVVDANGGVVSSVDSRFDKITWNVNMQSSISRTYTLRSPAVTNPNSKYVFYTELVGRSEDWLVIVADASNVVEELLPIFHVNTKLGNQLTQQEVDLIRTDDNLYFKIPKSNTLQSELEDHVLNADVINNAYCDLFYYTDAGFNRNVEFQVLSSINGLVIDSILIPESTAESIISLIDLQNKGLIASYLDTLFVKVINNERGKQGKSVFVDKIRCIVDYGVASSLDVTASNELGQGLLWDIQELPVSEQDAIGNNGQAETSYFIDVNSEGTNVDVYLRGSSDLIFGTERILLQNEKVSYSTVDSTLSGANKNIITTNYIDNKIGENLPAGSRIYLKFYLTIPIDQKAGDYLNFIEITAVPTGVLP